MRSPIYRAGNFDKVELVESFEELVKKTEEFGELYNRFRNDFDRIIKERALIEEEINKIKVNAPDPKPEPKDPPKVDLALKSKYILAINEIKFAFNFYNGRTLDVNERDLRDSFERTLKKLREI